nr:MAG TPA: hypothetical protein [Caudoviricetes sp.]
MVFVMNGYEWHILRVDPNDPRLVDRTRNVRLATTDPNDLCVYLSNELSGEILTRVLIHELGHCAIFSYGLEHEIHRFVKRRYWVEAEESICNFLADYGRIIFNRVAEVLGNDAWRVIPFEFDRLIS